MENTVVQQIKDQKLIAIVRGVPMERALRLAEALVKGGIHLIEVTFDQSNERGQAATTDMIAAIAKEFGGSVCVGAGTVLSQEQVCLAADAGARYIISPDVNPAVIEETCARNMVSIPGAFSPTEVVKAWQAGAHFVKLFPAGQLGSEYVKALCGPLGHIPMLAVGGIHEGNIPAFLKAGCLGFGIGGNLVNQAFISSGSFEAITETAKALCRTVGR